MKLAAALALPLFSLTFAPAAHAQTTAVENAAAEALAVDRARAAIGWDRVVAHPGAVRVTADAELLGTAAGQVELFDGRGRWLQTFDGPLAQRSGFDGKVAWTQGWNRTFRLLELGDRVDTLVAHRFLIGSWCAEDSPLRFGEGSEHEGGNWLVPFELPGSHLKGELELDASTWLPRGVSWGEHLGQQAWTFGAFSEPVDGYRFPTRITIEQAGQEQSLALTGVEFVEARDPSAYTLDPGTLEADTEFDPRADPRVELMQAPTGHLLVNPMVGGKDLGWFIFDTGAGTNCISSSVADELSEPFGVIVAQGIGGAVPTHFRRADELRLGPVSMADPVFMELDLAFLDAPFGVRVAGIIGYEFIARCVVEFDMAAPSIALFDPASYAGPAETRWEEAILYSRHPNVRASFEGHEGVFKIDTGAAGDTLSLHYQAVVDLDLLEGRQTRAASAGGVGGSVSTRSGTATSFLFGGHDFRDLRVEFTTEDKGAFSNDYVWGNVGGVLLEPFVVVFDYPGKRIGFVPKEG